MQLTQQEKQLSEAESKRKPRTVFSKEEDQMIRDFVSKNGAHNWNRIEKIIQTRTGRQCRERWKNFLSPSIFKREWSLEEDFRLKQLVALYGQRWSMFADFFPGRTDIIIRNRYSLLMRHMKKGMTINQCIQKAPEPLNIVKEQIIEKSTPSEEIPPKIETPFDFNICGGEYFSVDDFF